MKRWYIVNTYSGYENSVKTDLERRRESMNMQDYVLQVLVPEETVEVTDKKGKKKQKVNKLFPGYVFVEMNVEGEMDDHAWFMIRNTPKVTGFLGSSGGGTKPVPVPTDEMDRILSKLGMVVKPKAEFSVGDKIVVTSGPFKDYTFDVAEIDEAKSIVVVFADLLGSAVRTELSFDEVKKI
jgi:transcriptional antiterminator NusG